MFKDGSAIDAVRSMRTLLSSMTWKPDAVAIRVCSSKAERVSVGVWRLTRLGGSESIPTTPT